MHLVFGQDVLVTTWVALRLRGFEGPQDFGPCSTIGMSDGQKLVSGVVYNNFREGNVEMTIAADSPGWAQRRFLKVLFGFPFGQLECRRVTATTARTNRRARKLVEGLGFKLEGVLRQGAGPKQDAMIYGMLKNECKWIRG